MNLPPRPDQKFRIENRRNRHGWTEQRLVRDHEAPGSNPGPPTIFVFKIADFRVSLESAAHSRITISGEPNRGGVDGVVVGRCEIAAQRPVAMQRPTPADARARTVRPGLKSGPTFRPQVPYLNWPETPVLADATASRRYFARNSRAFSTNCSWNWKIPAWPASG